MNGSASEKRLGRYELLFLLGQGGMGEVHLARLTGVEGFEKLCIVKTILPQMKADPQFVERFRHEARVLVLLNHSSIAQVYDMGDYEGTLYMAIEYVPGVDLARVENRVEGQGAAMPVPVAIFLGRQICEALGYAHRKTGPEGAPLGIVHRDVSPQNVMVSYEGEVKVIDFGLAKSAARSKHTLPSTVMGKLGYMAPEQALARPVDNRSDIYSAGIVIWELLAGRALFQGGTMAEMVAQMAMPIIPSLRSIRPDLSPTLDQAVMKALEVDPAARYQRAEEFARVLNELAVREGLTVGAEEVGNYVRAMCPEEFASERQLQSKLSALRRKGAAAAAPTAPLPLAGASALATGPVEGTFVRDSQPPPSAPVRAPSVPPAHLEAGPSAEYVVPRSKAPYVVLAAALLVVGAVVAWRLVSAPEPAPPPAPVVVAAPPALPEIPSVAQKPAPAEPPGVERERERVEAKEFFSVARKGDGLFIVLETAQRLEKGARLKLVGPEGADGKRAVFGEAVVFAVNGGLVEVLPEVTGKLTEPLFAVRDAAPARPAVVAAVPHEAVHATPRVEPVVPRVELKAEPPPEARPELKPPPTPVVEPATPVVPPPAAKPLLRGAVVIHRSVFSGAPSEVVITNSNPFAITNCDVRVPGEKYMLSVGLRAGDSTTIDWARLYADKRPRLPDLNYAAVYCNEGAGSFPVQRR
jgi:serine/threonine-protein kinase